MDKNFLIAILLSTFLIIIYASPLYQKRFGRDIPQKSPAGQQSPALQDTVRKDAPVKPSPSPQKTITEPDQTESTVSQQAPSETAFNQINVPDTANDIILENTDIRIVISPHGGVIKHVILKKYDGPSPGEPVQLVYNGEIWYDTTITTDEAAVSCNRYIFRAEKKSDTEAELTAELDGSKKIVKEFSLEPSGYLLHASTNLSGTWEKPALNFSWNGPVNETEVSYEPLKIFPFSLFMRNDRDTYKKLVYLGDGSRKTFINGEEKTKSGGKRIFPKEDHSQKIEAKKAGEGTDIFDGALDWYAVRNLYFISVAIPEEKERWTAESHYSNIAEEKWFDFTLSKKTGDGNTDLDIYLGPISYFTLKEYDRDLTEAMELSFRFVRPLSIAFLWLFKKLHTFISNWGLVIIVFSIIIKLVLYPLSMKSYDSMSKMSSLQPQINELKTKYKNNPQMLHKATMELYKKEGVNPFSGCLPNLLQLPVFFALFPVVGRAFELRQAMFIPHWIEDLSRPDPFYILPIAMGISMFFQTKATMKDPSQKPMLYMMPVMMVIFLANFSAGLSLYWFMFNIMTFLQQKIHRTV